MKWNYRCPKCHKWRNIEWAERKESHRCHQTHESYYPPTLLEQHEGYLNTHEWPPEMEKIVVALKGENCTVPNCTKHYETLDHRVPYSKKGKTSVENLFPICEVHNLLKGDKSYIYWLMTLKQ